MGFEFAEIAGGLPLAASFAMATGITAVRQGRRRSALNEAMHELRRPLQTLALVLPADSPAAESSLRMAAAAIDRLEREVNRKATSAPSAQVSLKPVVEVAVERWQRRAALSGRSLRLSWNATDLDLLGDEVELTQAVDNLISNALDHGAGEVSIEVEENDGHLCLAVRDGGPAIAIRRPGLQARFAGRGRHGHGLRIVRRAAARHGGSFRLRCSSGGSEARLDLPLLEEPG